MCISTQINGLHCDIFLHICQHTLLLFMLLSTTLLLGPLFPHPTPSQSPFWFLVTYFPLASILTSFFSCCCDKVLCKSYSREKGFILAHGSKLQYIMNGVRTARVGSRAVIPCTQSESRESRVHGDGQIAFPF